jgi:hypothetical protein
MLAKPKDTFHPSGKLPPRRTDGDPGALGEEFSPAPSILAAASLEPDMKRLICCTLLALLAGCIPIGFQARTSSLSIPQSTPVSSVALESPGAIL